MSLESRINQLIKKAAAREKPDPKFEAMQAKIKAMSTEELRALAAGESGESNSEFACMSDRELWEIIAREES